MCSKGAGNETRLLLILGLKLFKHRGHRTGIVAGGIHVLNTKLIGFLFRTATELHEDAEQADASCVLINHSWNTAEEYRGTKRGVFQKVCLGLVLNGVTSGNVSNFMRHYTS